MLEMMRSRLKQEIARLARIASPRRFLRHTKGAAAVEFGLVAVPFFALILFTIQTALVFFADQTLETMVQDGARLIMTGQAQNNSWGASATTFRDHVCPSGTTSGLFNCDKLFINVVSYSSFGDVSSVPPPPRDPKTKALDPSQEVYNLGGACSIVIVQMYYEWPIFGSLDNLAALGTGGTNTRLLVGTAAFRNEPYSGSGASC